MDVDSVALESFLELNFPSELSFPMEFHFAEGCSSDNSSSFEALQPATEHVSALPSPSAAAAASSTQRTRKQAANPEYNLRPRSMRMQTEQRRKTPFKRDPKPKQKPPPLSKYRRKTANARERCRMQEINKAFEDLRAAVPNLPGGEVDENGKMTKITTLRLAVNYIAALSEILKQADDGVSEVDSLESSLDFGDGALVMPPDLVGMILESDGESLQLSDESRPSNFGEAS